MCNKKAPLNPFVLTGYYGKTWFCNREEEINMLKDHVLNDRNVVMYSLRRMGKLLLSNVFSTSFLMIKDWNGICRYDGHSKQPGSNKSYIQSSF